MQIINMIEVVCADCGGFIPVPIFGPERNDKGVWVIKAMPCPKCNAQSDQEKSLMKEKSGFDNGIVYACARVIELFDEPTIAENILDESGADFQTASEDDVAIIREALPHLNLQRGVD